MTGGLAAPGDDGWSGQTKADPWRVALIGYGYAAATFHAPLLLAEPGLALVMVASSDAAKVRRDLGDIAVVADPISAATCDAVDLVVIATPNETHFRLARAALMADRHVVVDKPFTLDLAEARELVALAAKRNLLLSVFHNRRWDSDFLSVQRELRADAVGEVVHFESHLDRFRPEVRPRWREQARPGSGIWFDLGPHLVDQALLLFGMPDTLQASFARQRSGAVTPDWAHVVLEYSRLRVVLHAGMLAPGGGVRFIVHGDRASLVKQGADSQEDQLRAGLRPGDPGWGSDRDALIVYDGSGGSRRIAAAKGDQRAFYAGIAAARRGGRVPVPARQAMGVMAVVAAAAQAAQTGRRIAPDIGGADADAWHAPAYRPLQSKTFLA